MQEGEVSRGHGRCGNRREYLQLMVLLHVMLMMLMMLIIVK
jgi:hypothetical protein